MATNDEINTKKLRIAKSLNEHYIHSEDNGIWIMQLIDEIEDKARADERAKVQKEMLNGKLKVKSGTKLGDFLPQKEIRKLSEIVQKEIIEPSLNKARADTLEEVLKVLNIFDGLLLSNEQLSTQYDSQTLKMVRQELEMGVMKKLSEMKNNKKV
jgi:hypothetical protein